jgi:MinD-like ATPase involved in chromosome partitioning or flagellar assembly
MTVGLETRDLRGVDRDRVLTVLNRANSKVGLLGHEVKQVLGGTPDVSIPSDRALPRSTNSARPIVAADPRSAPAKALRSLGQRIAAELSKTDGKG